jgi:flavin reductase (DIM6/NTAB) family NADH-FMN oxidoreductase RutF
MSRELRDAFGCFATGVTLVTTRWDAQDWGMTCSSFNSVSLDPAIVLWSIRRTSQSHRAFVNSSGYMVNVLGSEHEALAHKFTKGEHHERFQGVEFSRTNSQRLKLVPAVAWFDCELTQVVAAGDHDILIARVIDFGSRPGHGLVFERSRFGLASPLPPALAVPPPLAAARGPAQLSAAME